MSSGANGPGVRVGVGGLGGVCVGEPCGGVDVGVGVHVGEQGVGVTVGVNVGV